MQKLEEVKVELVDFFKLCCIFNVHALKCVQQASISSLVFQGLTLGNMLRFGRSHLKNLKEKVMHFLHVNN